MKILRTIGFVVGLLTGKSDISCQLVDVKGEFVIVIEGNKDEKTYEHLTITQHVNLYLKEGKDTKDAIKLVAKDRNMKKQDVYNEYHGIK